jgi:endonuclease/exonuclease/phosphatase family metal-dependent hydrolase
LGDFNASSSAELDLFTSSLHDVGPQPSKAQLSNLPTNVEKLELKFRNRPTFGSLYPFVDLKSTKPRKPRRIDRIYVSKGTKYGQYRELGGEALSGEKDQLGKGGKRYPSDHLAVGIRVEL